MRGPSAMGSRSYPGKTLKLKPAGLQQAPILPRGRRNRRGDGKRWQMITEDQRRHPLSITPGSTTTLWHSGESSKANNSATLQSAMLDRVAVRFCLRSAPSSVMLSRDLLNIFSLRETKTRSQASSVISQRPVTAGCAFGTSPYPILHLFHSAPTDQQSNFTQAGSDWGKH